MKRRRFIFLGIGILLLTGISLLPATRWRIKGWMNGEAFYQSRPTSYWRQEILALQDGPPPRPAPNWWDRLIGNKPAGIHERFHWSYLATPEAIPVLGELLQDADTAVRHYAIGNLGMILSEPDTILPLLISAYRVEADSTIRARLLVVIPHFWARDQLAKALVLAELEKARDDEALRRALAATLQDHP